MSHLENELISSKCIVQFTLPRLHKGKQWYVDFFAYDPARGKMRRKKYMLDHYKNEQDRENIAAILIHNIFEKLKVDGTHSSTQGRHGNSLSFPLFCSVIMITRL